MKNIKSKSKIEHLWTIACSSSSIDGETNNVSLFNIIEEVGIQLQPPVGQVIDFEEKKAFPLQMEIISLWKRLVNDVDIASDIKIELLDPNNKKLQEMPYRLEIKSQHQRMRMRIRVNGMNFTGQGEYHFSVLVKEEEGDNFQEVARIPLLVKIASLTGPQSL